jgi:hypothetical protein
MKGSSDIAAIAGSPWIGTAVLIGFLFLVGYRDRFLDGSRE